MDELKSSVSVDNAVDELLYFWALGDLHYCAIEEWRAIHTQRLTPMYRDLRLLWAEEGAPAFCVSPGDIVEKSAPENYQLAKRQLTALLGKIPFCPGLGNHELWSENGEDADLLIKDFTTFWGRPARYYWVEGKVLCVMLDPVGYPEPYLTQESLSFLQTALAKHPGHNAIVFSHCSLFNTVLDRDPERELDYHTLDPFFYIKNSDEVRAMLARYKKVGLFLSGHTHSGWGAPNLVYTEQVGGHPVTHINLMSPWYTGFHRGAILHDGTNLNYHADDPDLVVSFAIRIYHNQAIIKLRDHRESTWMAQWTVPLS